jgi:hypothetical protein
MRVVTDEEFYNVIGPKDVTLSVVGNYPYRTDFKLRHGGIIGYQDRDSKYYLVD